MSIRPLRILTRAEQLRLLAAVPRLEHANMRGADVGLSGNPPFGTVDGPRGNIRMRPRNNRKVFVVSLRDARGALNEASEERTLGHALMTLARLTRDAASAMQVAA